MREPYLREDIIVNEVGNLLGLEDKKVGDAIPGGRLDSGSWNYDPEYYADTKTMADVITCDHWVRIIKANVDTKTRRKCWPLSIREADLTRVPGDGIPPVPAHEPDW